jgi:hypothetical protein
MRKYRKNASHRISQSSETRMPSSFIFKFFIRPGFDMKFCIELSEKEINIEEIIS